MYVFQSKFRVLDMGGYAKFKTVAQTLSEFSTDSQEIAEKIRKSANFGSDVWELPQEEAQAEHRRVGRPRKVVETVRGPRTSEIMEKQQ